MISDATLRYWAWKADVHEKMAVKGDEGWRGRAAQPHMAGWKRYNRGMPTVRVVDIDGRERWITEKQEQVLVASIRLKGRGQFTVTQIAASIGQSPSSVSRTLVKLASFGLVAYDTRRGRYGGVSFIDVLTAELRERAQEAWEWLKAVRQKAAVRLWKRLVNTGYPDGPVNVASMFSMDATLTMTEEEEAAIIAAEYAEMGL